MRLKLTLSDRYETAPTGETIDRVFEKVLESMHRRMNTQTNQESHVAESNNLTSASIVVREDKKNFNIKLESEFGGQNKGYLLELEIRGTGDSVGKETAEKIHEQIESILHDVTKIK